MLWPFRLIFWIYACFKDTAKKKWNEYVTISENRTLSNCKIARKKGFSRLQRDSNPFLCVRAAVLYQLSYKDPYTGGRPIYWVHQPVKGIKHRMKWCELREYKWNEYVTIAVNRNLSSHRSESQFKFTVRSSHHFILCLISFTGWWTQ